MLKEVNMHPTDLYHNELGKTQKLICDASAGYSKI